MKITFLGADHEVTGSCHYLNVCGKNVLIDCGMEQGEGKLDKQEILVDASEVDYVLLTHAHIDHSGLLPLLYIKGFRGKIYTTYPTMDLCNILLRDSAHIQTFEAEWRNRKAKRANQKEFVPLYDMKAAEDVLKLFVGCKYEDKIQLSKGLEVRFTDAGHLLGSASIEVWAQEENVQKKIVFSGDIGNINKPLINNPKFIKEADYVIMESTYGDRSHGGSPDYIGELVKIFKRTFERGGNVVIPSFAVGRTQELLYFIRQIKQDKLLNDFDVYVDSPLAIEATNIYSKNYADCFDEEAMELINKGINPISFLGLKLSVESEESKAINFDNSPKVIISASGMCDAGRIKHHLKHNLWRPECTVLFVGYQANGSLGRRLVEGAKEVKLFGEPIQVNAEIAELHGFSGHADKDELLRWINAFEKKPEKVFVVHGEDTVCELFTARLKDEYGFNAIAPFTGASYDLATGECIDVGNKGLKKVNNFEKGNNLEKSSQGMFEKLALAGKRLLAVINHNESNVNKDTAKFVDEINSLSDKWDR